MSGGILRMVGDYGLVMNATVHPEWIMSLSPNNMEILFAVGAGDKIVGVTDHCSYLVELEVWIETRRNSEGGWLLESVSGDECIIDA